MLILPIPGRCCFNVSDEFEDEQIGPEDHRSVLFTIETKDIESLAAALLHISYGYINDHPDDTDFSYIEESANYLDEIDQGDIVNTACPYFVDISREFEQEAEDD